MKLLRRGLLLLGLLLFGLIASRRVAASLRRSVQVSPEALADPDSHFVTVNGMQVHYKVAGTGNPTFVLLHGSFLSLFSWRATMASLAEIGTVIALDRPAFGLTGRPLPSDGDTSPYSPEAQADLTVALLDRLSIDQAVLVGNSTGGTIALLAALRHPTRVQALVLASAMVYSGYAVTEFPAWMRQPLRVFRPVGQRLVRVMIGRMLNVAIRSMWFDKSRLTPEILAEYRKLLQIYHWDRAFWELTLATHALGLAHQLSKLHMPALVIAGDNDRTVRTDESVRLADELPNATLVVVPDCGHLPQEEQPEAFVRAVQDFVASA